MCCWINSKGQSRPANIFSDWYQILSWFKRKQYFQILFLHPLCTAPELLKSQMDCPKENTTAWGEKGSYFQHLGISKLRVVHPNPEMLCKGKSHSFCALISDCWWNTMPPPVVNFTSTSHFSHLFYVPEYRAGFWAVWMFAAPLTIQGWRSSVGPRMKISRHRVMNPSVKPSGMNPLLYCLWKKILFSSTVVKEEIEKSFVEQSTFHLKNPGKIKWRVC